MKLTKIAKENEAAFLPFLPGYVLQVTPTLVRVGVTDDKDRVAGVMAMDTGRVYMELLALYILPEYRRRGYGRYLMEMLLDAVDAEKYTAVSAGYMEGGGLTPFFESQGYDVFPSTGKYSFSLGEFMRSEFCSRYIVGQAPKDVMGIVQLESVERKVVDAYLEDKRLPLKGWYDPRWSSVLIRNGDISSIMLAGTGRNGVSLIWLYSKGQYQNELVHHMRYLLRLMEAIYNRNMDTRINFMAENTKMLDFMVGILGGMRRLRFESRYVQAIRLL